jgi:iron(III) transport system ATP-binding protein
MNVSIDNITKVYRSGQVSTRAVDGVSAEIASGEFFFLLGPSGCGKTTLLRMIAGLIEPTSGRVLFAGRDVTNLPVERRKTAMVFQSYALWPHMSVRQNVEFGPRMRRVTRADRRRVAEEQLTRVQMAAYARRRPNQLSGGQQQRVALARALAAEADLLLLDEPLSNLDARLRLHMRTELRRLVKSLAVTAIYVTHDQKEALSMADRIAVMSDGKIVQIGSPEELYNAPASVFVADFLGEANFIDGRLVEAGPPALVETPLGTVRAAGAPAAMAGEKVACCIRPERVSLSSQPPAEGGGRNVFPATIESITYLGEIVQYVCLLGLTGEVRCKVSSLTGTEQFAEGRRVHAAIARDDVAVLPPQRA